jgi:hypothetical protein
VELGPHWAMVRPAVWQDLAAHRLQRTPHEDVVDL